MNFQAQIPSSAPARVALAARSMGVLAACLLVSLAAVAERTTIDISGATFRPYPLAIVPLRSTSTPAAEGIKTAKASLAKTRQNLSKTLRYDLEVSGLFQVLDPRSFLAKANEGFTPLAIHFDDWANVGAEGLLKARLSKTGETLRLEGFLFAVTTASQEAHWSFEGAPADARQLAHQLADAVVRSFTKERSIFDTKLCFIRKVKGKKQLWISDWDGFAPRRVMGGELNLLPAWAPSGQQIVFTSYRNGDPDLFLTNLAGTLRVVRGGDAMFTGGAFSPDGKKIAYTRTQGGNAEIYVAGADGRHPHRLTDAYGIDTSPSWSPDGHKIAFVSARHGNPHIFVMNANGSGQKRITFKGNYNQTPDWSPRGDVIAFTARDERNVFDLFTVSPETGDIRRLTQDTGNNEEPSFSPDGRHIVFASTRRGKSELWIMNADGTGQRRLQLPPGHYFTPSWGPWPAQKSPIAK